MASQVDVNCPICLNVISAASETSCGHAFCGECILEQLQHSTTCPVCRAPIHSVHRSITLRNLLGNGNSQRDNAIDQRLAAWSAQQRSSWLPNLASWFGTSSSGGSTSTSTSASASGPTVGSTTINTSTPATVHMPMSVEGLRARFTHPYSKLVLGLAAGWVLMSFDPYNMALLEALFAAFVMLAIFIMWPTL
eukprot:m.165298 g.165298  ORF g.165298 m.165298 type:complete len:193 (+) comp14430_c0_seq3:261-839(+)